MTANMLPCLCSKVCDIAAAETHHHQAHQPCLQVVACTLPETLRRQNVAFSA